MLVLAGLGNPGPGYAGHRHNLGFIVLDAIVARYRFSPWRRKFQGEIAQVELDGIALLALKPMTYMNLSGQSVAEALRFYKLGPDALTVFHDEVDLPLGRVKVKTGGGAGGHNGVRDVIAHVGEDFRRVRMGVDHPGDKRLVEFYVLQNFAKEERPRALAVVEAVTAEIPRLLGGDDSGFMSRVALILNPPPPKPPRNPAAVPGPGEGG